MKWNKLIAIGYFFALFFVTILSRLTGLYPAQVIAGGNWKFFHWFRENSYNDIVYSQNWLIDFLGNIILFMPFIPCLMQFWKHRKIWLYILVAFFTSVMIELLQYKLSIGLATPDDVLLNTLGAYLGHILFPYAIRFYNQLEK